MIVGSSPCQILDRAIFSPPNRPLDLQAQRANLLHTHPWLRGGDPIGSPCMEEMAPPHVIATEEILVPKPPWKRLHSFILIIFLDFFNFSYSLWIVDFVFSRNFCGFFFSKLVIKLRKFDGYSDNKLVTNRYPIKRDDYTEK